MASALWAVAEGDRPPITVVTAGRDALTVGLDAVAGASGPRWEVRLTGPAEVAYRGEWQGEWSEAAPDAVTRA
jgi:hypothetical protein